eukprot:678009-Rhodomonas_salina.2
MSSAGPLMTSSCSAEAASSTEADARCVCRSRDPSMLYSSLLSSPGFRLKLHPSKVSQSFAADELPVGGLANMRPPCEQTGVQKRKGLLLTRCGFRTEKADYQETS